MDSNRLLIAAVLFIVGIIAINYAMFAIARAAAKSGDARWLTALRDSFVRPFESRASKSMDELRKKVSELEHKDQEK
jgi:hypothetical protein